MRIRLLPLGAAMALAVGLLTAAPATATYVVASITFPGGTSEFYSPFSGPATVTFNFDTGDPDALFELRLRPTGGSAIRKKTVFIDPDTQTSPRSVNFAWPALSVTSAKTYQVAVYRNDTLQGSAESFLLRPPLVTITGATPNPFLPIIDDGHKDTTKITFNLASDANAEALVYRENSAGKCCGILVRNDSGLNGLAAGPNQWVWDGKNNSNDEAGVGDYFVRISADDGVVTPALSKPYKVTIARTYRQLVKLQKDGMLMHHTGPVTSYRRGGNCFISKDGTDRDLWITCLSASFTVYWRWALPTGGRIESASFVYVPGSSGVCNGKKGYTKTDSSLKVGGIGQFHCRVDKAKITYSRPVQS
jgi:hypothetical protein